MTARIDPNLDDDAYAKALEDLIARSDNLDRTARRQTIELLSRLRAEVVATIAETTPGSRPAYRRALRSIDEAITRFVARYRISVNELQKAGFDLGIALAEQPLVDGGFAVGVSGVSDQLVDLAAGFSADLIGNIGSELRKRINTELVAVALGTQTPTDAISKIGRNMTDPSTFRTIGARAQAIVTTEVGRVQSIATQARMSELSNTLPGLRKRWMHAHVGTPRPNHLAAEKRYGINGNTGPIGVDDDFTIGGHKARYPRDGRLPASETVNCRCSTAPILIEVEVEDASTLDAELDIGTEELAAQA